MSTLNVVIDFKYNDKYEKSYVCVGMPVIATQIIKDKDEFNTPKLWSLLFEAYPIMSSG